MNNFKLYYEQYQLIEENAKGHLTHLEELLLTRGEQGYDQARQYLLDLLGMLQGKHKRKLKMSVKWDGAPFIMAGKHPQNGQHFVATKGAFAKEPKLNFTEADIDDPKKGYPEGLATKLKAALKFTKQMGIKGLIGGDIMYTNAGELKPMTHDGVEYISFKPNTTVYAVEKDSKLAKEISNSVMGVIWHSAYSDIDDSTKRDISSSEFKQLKKVPGVWMDDAEFTDSTGKVDIDKDEAKQVKDLIKTADGIKVNFKPLTKYLPLINIYLNSEIREGSFIEDPEGSFKRFLQWTANRNQKAIDKLKSKKGRDRKSDASTEQLAELKSFDSNIVNLLKKSKLLQQAKQIFINKYNNAVYNTKHFFDNGDGTLRPSNPEGYVAINNDGNLVKFVDRLEFSRANFGSGKPGAKR
tara:strand:+ start:2324 stop:3553 length:1230 start_codon:yes stop_codon:yes gene_type:complete